MQMDWNINSNGKGKYALVLLRKIPGNPRTTGRAANYPGQKMPD